MFTALKNLTNFISFKHICYALAIIGEVIYIHQFFFEKVIGDYKDFVSPWVSHIREHGFLNAFRFQFSNYAPLYLHLLAFLSLIFKRNIVVVKLLSIIFEVVLVIGTFKIYKRFNKNNGEAVVYALLTLLIPTVFINTAWWGQCDVIYVSIICLSVYYIICQKTWQAFLLLAISFSFKLQTIFIFPLFFLYCLHHRKAVYYFLLIPLVYIITILPSWMAGRSFQSLLTIYTEQSGGIDPLVINTTTIYSLFKNPEEYHKLFSFGGRCIAVAFNLIVCILFYFKKRADIMRPQNLLKCAMLITLAMPYFLPHMHERYFMLAEVFSLIYVFIFRQYYFLPIIIIYSSLQCYLTYLIGFIIFPSAHLAFLLLFCVIVLTVDLFKSSHQLFT